MSDSATTLSISGVNERDIDLLMLEEFLASPLFVNWFAQRILGADGEFRLLDVNRSVTQSNGESDLEATLENEEGRRIRFLIENKVNAGLQPQQAERYRARAETHRAQSRCDEARTVLVAPQRYFGSAIDLKGFDARLTYEGMRQWFADAGALGQRAIYKSAILTAAIQKGELGYQVIEDDAVSEFWRKYWELTREMAPELNMPRPTPKPSGSTFIQFKPNGLPKGVQLLHKLSTGNVDLQFSGYSGRLEELRAVFGMTIMPEMSVEEAGQSGVIRIKVPVINVARGIEEQLPAVRTGLSTAQFLLHWLPKDAWLARRTG